MEKHFIWDPVRNRQLLNERGVSFEDVVFYIQKGGLRDLLRFRNPDSHPQQLVMVVEIDTYVYLVAYIEEDEFYRLQTITPSKQATRQYSGNRI